MIEEALNMVTQFDDNMSNRLDALEALKTGRNSNTFIEVPKLPKDLLGAVYDGYVAVPNGWQPIRGRDISDCIQMYRSQRLFWPLQAHADEFHVEDVAFSLARQIRFIGQTGTPYNVAWHSVALSRVVPDELKQWALIHDAAEGYISDVCRPIKKLPAFDEFVKAEAKLMVVAAEYFGMEESVQPDTLEEYDAMMGTVELYHNQGDIGIAKLNSLMHDPHHEFSRPEYKDWKELVVDSPNMNASEGLWLKRHKELFS